MKKEGVILSMFLSVASLYAQTPIDLENFVVRIVSNASEESVQDSIKEMKLVYAAGDPEVKILTNVDFSCSSLGLKKDNHTDFPNHSVTVYKKEVEPGIEGICEEALYQDGKLKRAILMPW